MSRNQPVGRTENRLAMREGDRALRRQSSRAADELRAMRIRAGISQSAVAAAIGASRSAISRFEQGNPAISLRTRFRVAAVLGADLRMSAFEGSGALLRDAAQAPMLERILVSCDRRWRRTIEAAVPGPGRRSVDLRLDSARDIVLIEVETRIGGLEEHVRELHSKRQALVEALSPTAGPVRPIHVVLALPATRRHRSIVRDHPEIIKAAFPASSAAVLQALVDCGRAWPGDGILWISQGAASQPP